MRESEGMTSGKDIPSELWEKQSPHAWFQSTDFCRRRVLKHDQQDGPQTWGTAAGLDAIPDAQGPEARWVTPGFRVRLCLCCGLDTILGARPQGKMSREKRNQYPSRLHEVPKPREVSCLSALQNSKQTRPFLNRASEGIWLLLYRCSESLLQRGCRW